MCWTFVLKNVTGIDFRFGLGIAWNREGPTPSRHDILEIANSLVRGATSKAVIGKPGRARSNFGARGH
ncbi:hypothetical protein A6U87_20940 [Rhizobium sp. AC44/96]|nr:hypothetical protein A6U87_20940 [Rhizobium sp. AC44/96]